MTYTIQDLKEEIDAIPDTDVREWTVAAFSAIDDKFYTVPASKSGRFHPEDERLEGGTVRHTKRAFRALWFLCESEEDELDVKTCSMMLSAILLHDTCKGTKGCPHELAVRFRLIDVLGQDFVDKYPMVLDLIDSHMGRWGSVRPITLPERMVHYADNVAAHLHQIFSIEKDPSSEGSVCK